VAACSHSDEQGVETVGRDGQMVLFERGDVATRMSRF
jgi:hypothetical protein